MKLKQYNLLIFVRNLILLFFLLNILVLPSFAKDNKVSITKVGAFETNQIYFTIDVREDTLFYTEYSTNRFCILNITDLTNPTSISNYTIHRAHGFDLLDNYAYVVGYDYGMDIIDISSLTSPQKIGEYTPYISNNVRVVGDIAYVACEESLDIVDISDPTNPTKLDNIFDGLAGFGIFIEGNILYATATNFTSEISWLNIYNITNPSSPQKLGSYDFGERALEISVENNYLYAGLFHQNVVILDISNYENIVEISTYNTVNPVYANLVHNDILYLANSYSGFEIVDVSDKTNPVCLGTFYDGGFAKDLVIRDNYVFIADNNDAIEILKITGLDTNKSPGFGIEVLISATLFIFFIKKKFNFKKIGKNEK